MTPAFRFFLAICLAVLSGYVGFVDFSVGPDMIGLLAGVLTFVAGLLRSPLTSDVNDPPASS